MGDHNDKRRILGEAALAGEEPTTAFESWMCGEEASGFEAYTRIVIAAEKMEREAYDRGVADERKRLLALYDPLAKSADEIVHEEELGEFHAGMIGIFEGLRGDSPSAAPRKPSPGWEYDEASGESRLVVGGSTGPSATVFRDWSEHNAPWHWSAGGKCGYTEDGDDAAMLLAEDALRALLTEALAELRSGR